ncbi:MAG TPA: AAA family ATPase [Rhodocyclaceae bacterium]|nr:AAA family ATPase [Rhodocyclaceae bacterium]
MALELTLAAQRRLVEVLLDPSRHPHPAPAVTLIETHISFLLLTGPFAYKIKKAVDLGFVDYTRLERRHFFCQEELRLNGRLAPRLYLDVVPIAGSPEDPRLGGAGEPVEFAVRMAQFDQDRLLDRLIARGELTADHVDALAATVAAFHGSAPPAAPADDYGSPAAVWAPVAANFAHLRAKAGSDAWPLLERLEGWSRAEFQRLGEKVARRKAEGFVRECHGDLHLGNVALLEEEPTIFDCIEFNPELRWIDVINDLAFLVMDLAERGRPDYAWRLLNDWLEVRGDYGGLALLRFYQAYRALVRAKVAAIRAADPASSPADREGAKAGLAAYLAFAEGITAPKPPLLLVTHGLSGSGKTLLARRAAEALGAIRLRSDVERKRLQGLQPLARSGSGIACGLYADSATVATYRRLAELAAEVIAAGYPAIVDAACLARWQRDSFRDLARDLKVPFLILHCRAPCSVLEKRVAARARLGRDASEADLAVLTRQCRDVEPLAADELDLALTVDTDKDGPEAALERLRQRIIPAP